MGIRIFVDTSAFIALFDRKDQYYRKAKAYFEAIRLESTQLSTSNYIIDETLTRIRIQNGHKVAVEFGNHFFKQDFSKVLYWP